MNLKNAIVILLALCLLSSCNPYLTKHINLISKNKVDSIFVLPPIVETRIQTTPTQFHLDETINKRTTHLVNKIIHLQLFKTNSKRFKIDTLANEIYQSKIRAEVDTMLEKFYDAKLKKYSFRGKFKINSKSNFVLIPYFIWTMTKKGYEWGKCGGGGGGFYSGKLDDCTWTRLQLSLIIVDVNTSEVIFFKYNHWRTGGVEQPFEKRINKSFAACFKPIIRRLD